MAANTFSWTSSSYPGFQRRTRPDARRRQIERRSARHQSRAGPASLPSRADRLFDEDHADITFIDRGDDVNQVGIIIASIPGFAARSSRVKVVQTRRSSRLSWSTLAPIMGGFVMNAGPWPDCTSRPGLRRVHQLRPPGAGCGRSHWRFENRWYR